MAGTAVHLAVADILYHRLGKEMIRNAPLFYAGNIAPDAVHARTGYQRAYKKHTHLTEGISGSDFQNPDKLTVFYERVDAYTAKYYHENDIQKDLYLGYIIHLLTDALFNIHIRQQFVEAMQKEGIVQEDPEFFRRIIQDIESVDSIVVSRYPYIEDVRMLLDSVWDYEIKDFITADEINRSKRWVLNTFFDGAPERNDHMYYAYDTAYQFICYAADIIYTQITEGLLNGRLLVTQTKNSRFLSSKKKIIRSDALLHCTPENADWLLAHRITTIIDLRSDKEVLYVPCTVPDNCTYHHLPLHDNGVLPTDSRKTGKFYFQMAEQAVYVYPVLHAVAHAEDGVLFFCRSGKDRTGVVSALLLSLGGYTDEYIANDYEKSAENMAEVIDAWLPRHPEYERAAITPLRQHIISLLKLLREAYGSIEQYCLSIGLSDTEIDLLRQKVL